MYLEKQKLVFDNKDYNAEILQQINAINDFGIEINKQREIGFKQNFNAFDIIYDCELKKIIKDNKVYDLLDPLIEPLKSLTKSYFITLCFVKKDGLVSSSKTAFLLKRNFKQEMLEKLLSETTPVFLLQQEVGASYNTTISNKEHNIKEISDITELTKLASSKQRVFFLKCFDKEEAIKKMTFDNKNDLLEYITLKEKNVLGLKVFDKNKIYSEKAWFSRVAIKMQTYYKISPFIKIFLKTSPFMWKCYEKFLISGYKKNSDKFHLKDQIEKQGGCFLKIYTANVSHDFIKLGRCVVSIN